MSAGILGYSLVFELLMGYFALHLLFPNTSRRWVALGLGVILLITFADLSGYGWAELFGGHFDVFWREIFTNLDFR